MPSEIRSSALEIGTESKVPQWYSQNGEDKWICENLNLPRKGIFVDVGASDGKTGSNTHVFEQFGWTGLVIEPDPRCADRLRKNRCCAVVADAIGSDPTAVFYLNAHADYSGFNREGQPVRVGIKRLDEVLDAAGITQIDFLSIDTEGSELDVWNTFDPDKYKPRVVMIEWNTLGLPDRRAAIRSTVLKGPYVEVQDIGGNLIFERVEPMLATAPDTTHCEQSFNGRYHVPEERAELFHASDGGSTEAEYLALLSSLIGVLKPTVVLETGSYRGYGSIALASSIKANGLGRMITLEENESHAAETSERLATAGLSSVARVERANSIQFLQNTTERFDFAFLDSSLSLRAFELKILLDRKLLTPDAVIVIHDTSKRRMSGGHRDPESEAFWRDFNPVASQIREIFEFKLSRGLLLLRP